ncbi:MAG TPA: Ig-like domain-containing protein [Bacillota bacterium]|nr:Ig-like domain-containing protein [Bacillota bacterium]
MTSFDRIAVGDQVTAASGTVYFDSVRIYDSLPGSLSTEGFEDGFTQWTALLGKPSTTNLQKYNGEKSFVVDANDRDVTQVSYCYPEDIHKVVVVWFYDNAANTRLKTWGATGSYTTLFGIGVDTNTDTNKYVYWHFGNITSTDITRSTGWHKMVWDYRSGVQLTLYIDNTAIFSTELVTGLRKICLGDEWADGMYGAVYFDDISVQDSLPSGINEFSGDSFENGMGNWCCTIGSFIASTDISHTGAKSYNANSSTTIVNRYFSQNQNKVVDMWFYDDATTSFLALGRVESGSVVARIGVASPNPNYVYSFNGSTYISTSVPRTYGWHRFRWDYTSGNHVDLYIDNTKIVDSSVAITSFNRIGFLSVNGNAYFDSVKILDAIPADFSSDGFESEFSNWSYEEGTPSTSQVQKHTGNQSYVINEDTDIINYFTPGIKNKVIEIWFYDNYNSQTPTPLNILARVDDSQRPIGLGVNTPISATNYVYWYFDTTLHFSITNIFRSEGWHRFLWDYRSGHDVKMYIDNTIIKTVEGYSEVRKIGMGDYWGDGIIGNVYFDDITVRNDLPSGISEFSGDSFEDGFRNWCNTVGAPSSSDTASQMGAKSYMIDGVQDMITHYFPSVQNNKIVSMWFYDDPALTSLDTMGRVFAGDLYAKIGVYTATSTINYVYSISGVGNNPTNVSRTTGWHRFLWNFTSGNHVDLYIDSTLVATSAEITNFDRINLGDQDISASGTVYFDNVKILDAMPTDFTGDGFEAGFDQWAYKGTVPVGYTAKRHNGGSSYKLTANSDALVHYEPGIRNKVVELWYYDQAVDSQTVLAYVDDNTTRVGIGVRSITSTNKYIYQIGSTFYITNITRANGWHQFIWDYNSGANVKLYVDGVQIAISSAVTGYKLISLGDYWSGNTIGTSNCFDDVIVQNTLPSLCGSILINGGAEYTNIINVTLTLPAQSAAQMRFSNDNITWSAWEVYNNTKTNYSLSSGSDGERTVYVQYKNGGGATSAIYNYVITLDTNLPQAFSVTANPNNWTPNQQPVLTFTTTDTLSGVDHFDLTVDGGTPLIVTSPYQLPVQTDGAHTIIITAIDKAGNRRLATTCVYIDSVNPGVSITFPLDTGVVKKPMISIQANPVDSISGITKVEFYINDVLASTDFTPSFSYDWVISGLTVGDNYEITVKAYDGAGNNSETTLHVKIADPLSVSNINLLTPIY